MGSWGGDIGGLPFGRHTVVRLFHFISSRQSGRINKKLGHPVAICSFLRVIRVNTCSVQCFNLITFTIYSSVFNTLICKRERLFEFFETFLLPVLLVKQRVLNALDFCDTVRPWYSHEEMLADFCVFCRICCQRNQLEAC